MVNGIFLFLNTGYLPIKEDYHCSNEEDFGSKQMPYFAIVM